jgi:hypothetical protein
MKALTDKIIDSLKSRYDAVIFDEKTENEFSAIAFKEGLHVAIEEIKALEEHCSFEDAANVLVKYLSKRQNLMAVVNGSYAKLIDNMESN